MRTLTVSRGGRARARRVPRTLLAAASSLTLAAAAVLLAQTPAAAIDVTGTPAPVTGNATYFSGLGSPYGGCGLPQADLDTQNFVALNVFNTPGDYGSFPRPVPASDASILGMFDNGLNCGRYVQVTIGDYCTGTNDGAQNEPFCRNGSWVADQYNGATLTMEVADSCADSNAWCRDDPYHLDLAQNSLNQFTLNGAPVGNLSSKWNNRQISWQFVPAPNYSGDIDIGFIQSAQVYWPVIAVSHLANGIHGVQYLSGGTWQAATMDSDMGQDYLIGPTVAGGTQYEIQVTDASGALINNGRIYSFSLPASCANSCPQPYTAVSYTTSSGPGGPSSSPTPTASPTNSPTTGPTGSPTTSPSSSPTTGPSTSPTAPSGAACTLTESVTGSWGTGYQMAFTVSDSGTQALSSWTAGFQLAAGQTIANAWNAAVSQNGQNVTAVAESYNGALAPGASTSWGMVVNGTGSPPTGLSCAPG